MVAFLCSTMTSLSEGCLCPSISDSLQGSTSLSSAEQSHLELGPGVCKLASLRRVNTATERCDHTYSWQT